MKDYLNQWLATKKARKSEATHVRCAGSVNRFLATLGERADKPLTAITPRDVERFM